MTEMPPPAICYCRRKSHRRPPTTTPCRPINGDDVIDDGRGGRVVSNRVNVLFSGRGRRSGNRAAEGARCFELLFARQPPHSVLRHQHQAHARRQRCLPRASYHDRASARADIRYFLSWYLRGGRMMEGGYRPSDPAWPSPMPRGISTLSKQPRAWDLTKGSDKVISGRRRQLLRPRRLSSGPASGQPLRRGAGWYRSPSGTPEPRALPRHHGATLAVGGMDHGTMATWPPASTVLLHAQSSAFASAHWQCSRAPLRHQRGCSEVVDISAGMMVGDEGPLPGRRPADRRSGAPRTPRQEDVLVEINVRHIAKVLCDHRHGLPATRIGPPSRLAAFKRGDNTTEVSASDRENPKAEFGNFEPSRPRGIVHRLGSRAKGLRRKCPPAESTLVDSFTLLRAHGVGLRGLISRSTALSHTRDHRHLQGHRPQGRQLHHRGPPNGPALEKGRRRLPALRNPQSLLQRWRRRRLGRDAQTLLAPLARQIARPTAPCSLRWCTSPLPLGSRRQAALYVSNYAPDSLVGARDLYPRPPAPR